jgi:hypothetical protein
MGAATPNWNKDELKTQFSEVGEWARHYSNVRMTVTPVLAALSLGIMQFAIEKKGAVVWIPMVSSLILWLAAIVILLTFTYHTNRTTEHWAYIQKLLHPQPPPTDKGNVFLFEKQVPSATARNLFSYFDTPAFVGIILTGVYAYFLDFMVLRKNCFGIILSRHLHLYP